MSRHAIRVDGMGKMFHASARHPSRAVHEAIDRVMRAAMRRAARSPDADIFWALRGVSFAIERGESVAVMGSNGAGKSVLLKILARVTAPTEGRAEVRGHIAPLLEIGAGFHPELSGRDNVFFNGAILGMDRGQIRRKFDEIVAFSGVEAFIDVPIKLYSSGMRMRLAFSVAAHLEPDILLIDEAFAVGDASFRAMCREKIRQFTRHGCTLLLVSHDPGVVAELCDRGILLEGGHLIHHGPLAEVSTIRESRSAKSQRV